MANYFILNYIFKFIPKYNIYLQILFSIKINLQIIFRYKRIDTTFRVHPFLKL